jgi:hypothetical protein
VVWADAFKSNAFKLHSSAALSLGRSTMCRMAICLGLAAVSALGNGAVAAGGASACGDKKVWIDPRLVPQRPIYTREQIRLQLMDPSLTASDRQRIVERYAHQADPVTFPYANGYVLVSPTDPCIQQFVPQPR